MKLRIYTEDIVNGYLDKLDYRPGDELIRERYLDTGMNVIGKMLGKDDNYVKRRLRVMGLVIPKEILKKRVKANYIKKGATPPNKGKKQAEYMAPEVIARTAATRFKKGNVPPQKLPEGAITIRHGHKNRGAKPQKYIHLGIGQKSMPLQRYNWIQKHGPIPSGHVIRFKDGDTMNCEVDNLEMITMKENRIRNSGSTTLSDTYLAHLIAGSGNKGKADPELVKEILKNPELIELKRKQILLNRAINGQRETNKEAEQNAEQAVPVRR